MEKLAKQSASLCQNFYQRVKEIPGIVFYGDMEAERAPILSLNVKGWDSARLADMLSYEYGICVRAGGHCAPLLHEALGTDEQGAVRFSFSHFNTIEEVGKAADALKELANVDFQIHCDYTVTEKKQLEETEMTLDQGVIKGKYIVESLHLPLKLEKRLEALGMTNGRVFPSECEEPWDADH